MQFPVTKGTATASNPLLGKNAIAHSVLHVVTGTLQTATVVLTTASHHSFLPSHVPLVAAGTEPLSSAFAAPQEYICVALCNSVHSVQISLPCSFNYSNTLPTRAGIVRVHQFSVA